MKNPYMTALLISATMSITSCGNETSKTKTEKTNVTQTETAKYQCPMKCEGDKSYEKPGQCPKCNMALKKVD